MDPVTVSGYGQEEDRRRGSEAGCQYHLGKPVEPQEFLALLDSLSDKRVPAEYTDTCS